MIISEILGRHNQGWPRNLDFKFFLSIYLLKEHNMLCRFYTNITGCVGITVYSPETTWVTSFKEKVVFVKLFETSFNSNVLALFTELQCQHTDTFWFFYF